YELAGTVERLPEPRRDPGGPPVAALARYETVALVGDDWRCTVAGRDRTAVADLARAAEGATAPAVLGGGGPVESSLSPAAYRAAAAAVRELIRAGDCYEVNLVQRLRARWGSRPLALAAGLWAAAGPTSHRAYLGLPGGAVVSASP